MRGFSDRADAGQQLAEALSRYRARDNTIILALPRGGVPIAYEMACKLHLPMTVFLVRKIGVPGQEELAMGAISEQNITLFNEALIARFGITESQIDPIVNREKQELKRRLQLYRKGKALPDLTDKTVILTDDGIATGATIKAALSALKLLKPKAIVLAVPTASRESLAELASLADEVICLMVPEPFFGVGQWYQSFKQTSDDEVLSLLEKVKNQQVNHHE